MDLFEKAAKKRIVELMPKRMRKPLICSGCRQPECRCGLNDYVPWFPPRGNITIRVTGVGKPGGK